MAELDSIEVPAEVLNLIPRSLALDMNVLPLRIAGDKVVVALEEGYDPQLSGDLSFLLGKEIEVETLQRTELAKMISRFYGISEVEKAHAVDPGIGKSSQVPRDALTNNVSDLSSDAPVVGLVDRIIADAIRMKASDIHVEPYEHHLRVRFRLDGVLHEVFQVPREKSKAIISRLKITADLDIAEKRRPQDGRIRVTEGGETIDIRVSTLPTDFGEKVVLRILDKSQLQLNLSKLGFEADALKLFKRIVRLPYGIVLVTGPTGSGKTTTLYAALNFINHQGVNITTIEDPIEYNLQGVNQTHVRTDIGLTFAAALRSILRQDPNIIMVGEIRDSETAEIAIRAALTGHLVFSTLHTNDAPSAVTRLIDMGVEPFLVASSAKLILAQRLLRRLCGSCKEPSDLSEEEVEELQIAPDAATQTFYRPKGCPHCNNLGYQGRTAVYELLPIQNGMSDLITREVKLSELRLKARDAGMSTLREAALKKAERGETSVEEVIRETAS